VSHIDAIWLPNVHLPRFIDEIEEHYHAVDVSFRNGVFRLSLLTQLDSTIYYYPRFQMTSHPSRFPESIIRISGALSTRLTTVEKLCVTFDKTAAEDYVPWAAVAQVS
jgi:hypothetical protein